jgi:probable F420-dependent oxidoreductase
MGTGIGIAVDRIRLPLETILECAQYADKSGVDSIWITEMPNQRDGNVLLAAIAGSTRSAQLATGIQGLYQRPPVFAAQAALSLDELSGNRVILGLGAGHRLLGEWMAGGTYTASVDAMREYLSVVTSLIRNGEVNVAGKWYSGHATYSPPRRPELPVYLGASGPRMLELAGELADGAHLWLVTPGRLRDVVMPRLRAGWARQDGDHREFKVVVSLYVQMTDDVQGAVNGYRSILAGYAKMENWKRHLSNSGFRVSTSAGSIDDSMVNALAAIGSAEHIRARIAEYWAAGATEVVVCGLPVNSFAPTLDAIL